MGNRRNIRKVIVPTNRSDSNKIKKPLIIPKRQHVPAKPINENANSHLPALSNSNLIIPPNKGNRVFIIGGGPTVNSINLNLLKDEDTICINAAINFVPNATYFVTMDYSYFDPRRNINTVDDIISKSQYSYFMINSNNTNLKNVNGQITDIRHNFVYKDLNKFSSAILAKNSINPVTGFSLTSNNFAHGDNSGFCDIQLAILLGYKEIYLVGFDLQTIQGASHFHLKYGNTSNIKKRINSYKDNIAHALKLFQQNSDVSIETITPSGLEPIIKRRELSHIQNTKRQTIMSNPYVIVSYYTINTPYEQEAAKLRNSLEKLKVPYDIVGVPNLGDWQSNTRFKAKFMQDMLRKHKGKSVVWVDSDAVIHSYPKLFDTYDCDVAVRWQDFRWRKNECLSGTIYLANNPRTLELCRRWEGINIAEGPGAKTFEQWNLGKVIEEMRNEGKIKDENLPPEYTMIFDSMRTMYPNIVPVIEHFQARRKLKNKV